jgi:hypothetical protein
MKKYLSMQKISFAILISPLSLTWSSPMFADVIETKTDYFIILFNDKV